MVSVLIGGGCSPIPSHLASPGPSYSGFIIPNGSSWFIHSPC